MGDPLVKHIIALQSSLTQNVQLSMDGILIPRISLRIQQQQQKIISYILYGLYDLTSSLSTKQTALWRLRLIRQHIINTIIFYVLKEILEFLVFWVLCAWSALKCKTWHSIIYPPAASSLWIFSYAGRKRLHRPACFPPAFKEKSSRVVVVFNQKNPQMASMLLFMSCSLPCSLHIS